MRTEVMRGSAIAVSNFTFLTHVTHIMHMQKTDLLKDVESSVIVVFPSLLHFYYLLRS